MEGNNMEAQPKKSNIKKIILIILGVLIFLCFACMIFGYVYGQTPEYKGTATQGAKLTAMAPTPTITNTPAPTQEPTSTNDPTSTETQKLADTLVPTETPQPTDTTEPTKTLKPSHTPLPELDMDLSQWVSEYDSMTDLQKKDFISESIGEKINWSGTVYDVKDSGEILVDIPGALVSKVSIKGIPISTAKTISKKQTINFTGKIENIANFLGLYIYIVNAEIE
jgi:hypothetical protein